MILFFLFSLRVFLRLDTFIILFKKVLDLYLEVASLEKAGIRIYLTSKGRLASVFKEGLLLLSNSFIS